jgi:hypothetical protein
MLDTNEVIPGIPSSPHLLEAQANYNAGMPISLDGRRYNPGGDWSQFTKVEPSKYRLSIGKELDAIREMGKSGLIHFNEHIPSDGPTPAST